MPVPNQAKLNKLKQLLELANDGLNRKDFEAAFKEVFRHVMKTEIKALEKINKLADDLKSQNNNASEAIQADIRALADELNQSITKALKEQKQGLEYLIDKAKRIKDFKDGYTPIKGVDYFDGKDAVVDEEKIAQEVLSRVDLSEFEEAIEEFRKKLDEIRDRPARFGGGTSAMGVAHAAKYFVKREAPSGDIDGVNLEYSVTKPIYAILSFVINGEHVAGLPNYSVSGRTITFNEAIPAAYNGKDIEVVYI